MSADRLVRARRAGALALVTALTACSWFTDFKEQPKIDPWESADSLPMRGNPQNSVSLYGTFAPGFAVSRGALPATIDSMAGIANPIPADARSLRNGRMYFTINCAVCHGYEGKGDGPIVAKGFPGIPLVGAASPTPGRTDGYIWGMIRNGRGLMPSYDRIGELDRWDVVNYLRGLQGRYTVQTGAVGLPGETGDKVPGPSQMGPTRPVPYYVHAGSQAGYAPNGPAVRPGDPGSSPMDGRTGLTGSAADSAAAPAPASTAPAAGDSARRSTPPTAAPGGAR